MPGTTDTTHLSFDRDGAQLHSDAISPVLSELDNALANLPADRAGIRLHGIEKLRTLLSANSLIGALAATKLGSRCRPVRAILFDKTGETNWSLGWHQDRTICVTEKVQVAGFGPWTMKQGMHYVAPPFELLSNMATLRIHLDDVPSSNAPLMIAPGSHRYGRIAEDRIDEIVRLCGTWSCLAQKGDVWIYSTPIQHASRVAEMPTRRRVLQVDYSAEQLPGGLRWLGI